MDELTCIGCSLVITGDSPEQTIDRMAQHFDQCDEAKSLLAKQGLLAAAEVVEGEKDVEVAGHLLSLSTPIMARDDEGEPYVEGMSTVFFGPYDTEEDVQAAADGYLLSMAGFNCGDDDCEHEHAHFVSVVSYHPAAMLDEFITDEQAHMREIAQAHKDGTCPDCQEEEDSGA